MHHFIVLDKEDMAVIINMHLVLLCITTWEQKVTRYTASSLLPTSSLVFTNSFSGIYYLKSSV